MGTRISRYVMMATSKEFITNISKLNTNICKPFTNLQPIKRNLYRIETERIYRVIEKGVKKLEEWQILMSIVEDDKKLFSISDIGLRDLALKQQYLIEQFLSGSDEVEDVMVSLFKEIFRYLHLHGISFKTYAEEDDNYRERLFLCEMLGELSHITFEKLLTEKEEEIERNKYLLQNMEKARTSLQAIKNLEQTLKEKIKEKDHELNEHDRSIRQCQQQIDSLVSSSTDENNTKLNEAAKQILTNQKNEEHRRGKQTQEIIETKKKLQALRTSHFNNESQLRKRKFKMSTELRNWVRKYDQDMGWRQEELEEIKKENEKDLEQIRQLEVHFVEVERNYNVVMEERRLQQEAKEKEMKDNIIRNAASITIQSLWRGHLVRREMRKKAVKEKKGKGGKKKKK